MVTACHAEITVLYSYSKGVVVSLEQIGIESYPHRIFSKLIILREKRTGGMVLPKSYTLWLVRRKTPSPGSSVQDGGFGVIPGEESGSRKMRIPIRRNPCAR
jgi:hypothetical protein